MKHSITSREFVKREVDEGTNACTYKVAFKFASLGLETVHIAS